MTAAVVAYLRLYKQVTFRLYVSHSQGVYNQFTDQIITRLWWRDNQVIFRLRWRDNQVIFMLKIFKKQWIFVHFFKHFLHMFNGFISDFHINFRLLFYVPDRNDIRGPPKLCGGTLGDLAQA